jgi:5'-3' exonuclease
MTKNDKYTILIDGNFMLHKTFHVAKNISKSKFDFIEDPKGDRNLLLWKLAMDFSSEIKRFDSLIDNVVYCIDGSSWRKHYFDDEELDTGDQIKYKANRVKSNDIDWKEIYDCHTEFSKGLEKLGVTVLRMDGCEADDLIFAWSATLNAKGKNALIISGDNDLMQLVNHDNQNGTNTIYYQKFMKTLYAQEGFVEWLDNTVESKVDIFDMPIDVHDISKDSLKNLVRSLEVTEINTEEFQFKKIIKGDMGDNVAPIYVQKKIRKSGDKKGQEYNTSPSDAKADLILTKFQEKCTEPINEVMFWNKEIIREICGLVKVICKYPEASIDELEKNYIDNRNLMLLHDKALPPPIMESMVDMIEDKYKLVIGKSEINTLKQYNNILDKTTYEDTQKKKQSSAGFFGAFNLD